MSDDIVDIAVETREGNFYQFLGVSLHVLQEAVVKAEDDGTVLSIVNVDSAAIVIPWHTVHRVLFISETLEDRTDDSWTELWERPPDRPARKARKVVHGK